MELREQVSHEEKVAAYGGALAMLFPIQWPEPFGLVMAESMATSTRVIAYANGAAPEVVLHEQNPLRFAGQSLRPLPPSPGSARSSAAPVARAPSATSVRKRPSVDKRLYRLLGNGEPQVPLSAIAL